ncbi:MAG: hypothetical protein P1V29_03860 [Gammaproteobacteria bacterium]|jgi:hypothetical protein|nr:hypothetical protein [Gammaproteobacteria bacterium]
MVRFVWTTTFVALITMIAIAEIGERITGIHIPWVMRLSIVLGVTAGYTFLKATFNLITEMEKERPLAGTVRNTLGPDRKEDRAREREGRDEQG